MYVRWGRWCSWLRHCATSQKVAGSIPSGVIGIIHWHNPSSRTVAWGSTQPLTEMSTRNAAGGWKWPMHRADNLTTFMCRLSWYLQVSNSWNPQVLSRPVQASLYMYVCQVALLLWLACYMDLLGYVNVMIIIVSVNKYNKIGAYNTRARKSDFLILWLCIKTVPSRPILLCCLSYEHFILVPGGSIAQDGDKPCKTNACVFEAPEDMDSMHNYEQVNFFGFCILFEHTVMLCSVWLYAWIMFLVCVGMWYILKCNGRRKACFLLFQKLFEVNGPIFMTVLKG